jgi:transcriptional antiterminator NusG
LKQRLAGFDLSQVPHEDAVEIKNNKRKTVQRKLLPGYVMVRMIMSNEYWSWCAKRAGHGVRRQGSRPTR